jgi:hypothetical protein
LVLTVAARLPVEGADSDTWGGILNQYLQVSHKADGSLNSGVVGSSQIAAGSVGSTHITPGAVGSAHLANGAVGSVHLATGAAAANLGVAAATNGRILTVDSSSQSGVSWVDPSASGAAFISHLTGVVVEQGGVYPARPTGYANVKFIGVNDPGSLAQDGDEWVKL